MGYVSKDKIMVFPSTQRGKDYRFISQEDLLRVYNLMFENKSFVISTQADVVGDDPLQNDGKLEFIIEGHYFKIKDVSSLREFSDFNAFDVYATLQKDKKGNINGVDKDGEFKGVEFKTVAKGGTPIQNALFLCSINKYVQYTVTIGNNICATIDGGRV